MIPESEAPLGVWNYRCPTCGVGYGMKCDRAGTVIEDVHQARLLTYRADPTWSPEAEASDREGNDEAEAPGG